MEPGIFQRNGAQIGNSLQKMHFVFLEGPLLVGVHPQDADHLLFQHQGAPPEPI